MKLQSFTTKLVKSWKLQREAAEIKVRNPWLALFELTNHNNRMCNAILAFVL